MFPKLYAYAITFIFEYLNFREKSSSRGTISQQASYWTSSIFMKNSDFSKKKEHCDEIIKLVKLAASEQNKASKTLIQTIFKIADLARETQAAQSTNKDTALIPYFISENSEFAKALHAMRTVLVKILKEDCLQFYNDEVNRLHLEYTQNAEFLKYYLKNRLNISELKNHRKRLFNQLLDLQDISTIENACIDDKFPNCLPTTEKDTGLDRNKPAVYNDTYYEFYYRTEISSQYDRDVFFTEHIKTLTDEKNILDNNNSIISNKIADNKKLGETNKTSATGDKLIQEIRKSSDESQSTNKKKIATQEVISLEPNTTIEESDDANDVVLENESLSNHQHYNKNYFYQPLNEENNGDELQVEEMPHYE